MGFRVLDLNHPSAELAVGLIFTTIPIYLTKQPDTRGKIEENHEFKCYTSRGGGVNKQSNAPGDIAQRLGHRCSVNTEVAVNVD